MRKAPLFVFLTLGLLLIGLQPGHAQAPRTWVSGVGDDANPCSRTAPCKTFPGAISKTAVKGEINVLDPGAFGTLTITKSISVIADNFAGAISASGGVNGIIINAGATDVINLRGLQIDGLGTGANGIRILSAGSVNISKSMIFGFTTANSSAIAIVPGVNPVNVTISDVLITQNKQGVLAGPTGAATATVLVDRLVADNTAGPAIRANGGGTIRVSNSVVTNNNRGLFQGGNGQIISAGNNFISGNATDGAFDSTVPLQ
jgi:hypothetical protein